MKCPACVSEGSRSSIYRTGGKESTGFLHTPFYDGDGIFHRHSENRITSTWACSNGHRMRMFEYKKCPSCDWNAGPDRMQAL